jgi:hypothetical protein
MALTFNVVQPQRSAVVGGYSRTLRLQSCLDIPGRAGYAGRNRSDHPE